MSAGSYHRPLQGRPSMSMHFSDRFRIDTHSVHAQEHVLKCGGKMQAENSRGEANQWKVSKNGEQHDDNWKHMVGHRKWSTKRTRQTWVHRSLSHLSELIGVCRCCALKSKLCTIDGYVFEWETECLSLVAHNWNISSWVISTFSLASFPQSKQCVWW